MKRARKKVSAEAIMFLRSLIGSVFLLLLAILFEDVPGFPEPRIMLWLLLFNGIVLLGMTKWLWVEAVHRISIPKAISLTSISPLFTLVFAYVLLGEEILWQEIVGIVPLLLGIYFLTRGGRKSSTPIVHPMV
jgi:drug/metabolite transporter (DMT)-like permease